ncbi:hypothetical protein IMZ11_02275 [Microtetraspora sp. AC03309]|uniref:hypothetical protein n=1 Tax=Microtetraspora sp. AC03309 TaxID=2779376 RepID=UPI001E45D620|nr:hypothetical protein [Microtetraspora sp. AC03309]MCC5574467.1 hypothetical protein [Microtetraspora sp. AC03309]
MPAPSYRYVFADLLTDAYITDLPLQDVSFDRRILQAGTFSASATIPNRTLADQVARVVPRHPDELTTGPGRTVCHVYRDGAIWGTYLIWQASVSRSGRGPIQVRLQGSTLESYLEHVTIRTDLTYEQVDQIAIARDLLTTMQSVPRYNVGLQLQGGTSGVLRDRTYLATEAAPYGQRLSELANVLDGFEYVIGTTVDQATGVRTRRWRWGYPQLGALDSDYVFAEPGNVLSWQEDIDALRGGTAFLTRGESINDDVTEASAPLTSDIYLAQDHLDAGWPGLDMTVDYSTVKEVSTLNDYASWWATHRAGAVRVHQATVRLDSGTAFSPADLGNYVRLMLVNDWWPVIDGVASFSKSWRVVGMGVRPVSRSSGQEEATLIFEEAVDP